MLGLEFVHDKAGKEPYPELVTAVIKEAAQHGLIMENCGIYDNVIRFLCPSSSPTPSSMPAWTSWNRLSLPARNNQYFSPMTSRATLAMALAPVNACILPRSLPAAWANSLVWALMS